MCLPNPACHACWLAVAFSRDGYTMRHVSTDRDAGQRFFMMEPAHHNIIMVLQGEHKCSTSHLAPVTARLQQVSLQHLTAASKPLPQQPSASWPAARAPGHLQQCVAHKQGDKAVGVWHRCSGPGGGSAWERVEVEAHVAWEGAGALLPSQWWKKACRGRAAGAYCVGAAAGLRVAWVTKYGLPTSVFACY